MRDGWSRRAVLSTTGGVGVLAVLSGCGWWDSGPADPPADPLEPLLASVQALAAGYEAALAAHPELTERLEPLYRQHLSHRTALHDLIGGGQQLPTPSPDAAAAWVPPVTDGATAEEVLARLGEAERAGWVAAREACLAAPPERARLLGSIAAARAVHGEVLA